MSRWTTKQSIDNSSQLLVRRTSSMFRGSVERTRAIAKAVQPPAAALRLARFITTRVRPVVHRNSKETTPVSPAPPLCIRQPAAQARGLTFAQRVRLGYRDASKGIFRKNPILFPFSILAVVASIALFAYIAYREVTKVGPQFHKFPPPVARALRRAIWYTDVDLKPEKALKAYKEALQVALELGMHPFSDEVLGIKLQVAMMLEKAGLVNSAVEVLERTRVESLRWVEEGRKKKAIQEEERKASKFVEDVEIYDAEALEMQRRRDEFDEYEERLRNKALKKVVGMQMKLAELYASDYIHDMGKAEAAQVAAVELSLKEIARRQHFGLPVGQASEDSDSWLNATENAIALAQLASMYTTQEKHELAMPLYLRALELLRTEEGDSPTCKQVVLLNGIASAMAGQAQRLSGTASKSAISQQSAISLTQVIDAASQWAQKAIDVAANIKPPTRNEECDTSCVAATYNLGELAELRNKKSEAEQRYREAKSLAQGIGFDEGIAMADTALKRLGKT